MTDKTVNNRDVVTVLSSLASTGHRIRIVIFGVLAVALSAIPAQADDIPEVNPDKFEFFVDARLKDRVKGYSFTLVAPGQTKADGAGGFAQDPANGDLPMSTSIVSNIGSVSKVVTGVAFLHLIRENPIADGTVNQQLDTSIVDYLPPRLRREYGEGLEDLTFRDILIHKSGLVQENSERPEERRPSGWRIIEWALKKGTLKTPGTGGVDYNNTNISLMRFFIPMIANPSETAWVENQFGDLPDREEYFEAILAAYDNMYKNYMYSRFFPRVFSGKTPVCNPYDELGPKSFAKSYPARNRTNGYFPRPTACAPQGGFFFSARQFAQFSKVFGYTNRLVKNGIRQRMMDPIDEGARLILRRSLNDPIFETETGRSSWGFHGGKFKNYRASFIPLPDNHYAAAVINSPEFSSGQLTRVLFDAFVYATFGLPAEHLSANDRNHFAYHPGIYVTAGNSQDFDLERKFYPSSLDGDKEYKDLFDISANNDLHFAWFKRNQGLWVMRGKSSDMDSDRGIYPSKIDPAFTIDNLIHVSSNDEMHFAWYNDNGELWVSTGISHNLASKRRAYKSELAPGKSVSDLVAIVSKNGSHYAYYDDCKFSQGKSTDLASIQVRRQYVCLDIER